MCQKGLRFGFELQIGWGLWLSVISSNYRVTTPALSLLCTPGELDPHVPTGTLVLPSLGAQPVDVWSEQKRKLVMVGRGNKGPTDTPVG